MIVTITYTVEVLFNDPDVWQRCTENRDNWRGTFADFTTQGQVAECIAVNYTSYHRTLSHIDGWADMPDSAVSIRTLEERAEAEWE